MAIDLALLILSVLSLHAGFGLVFGILISRTLRANTVTMTIGTLAYGLLIYFPSVLVIVKLEELSGVARGLILLAGIITTLTPFMIKDLMLESLTLDRIYKRYAITCMMLLTLWALSAFYLEKNVFAVPLALFACLAALATLLKREPAY